MNTDKLLELAEQLRRELHSHDAAYSYTQYEQGRVDEKRRTLDLLAAALRAEQAVGDEQRARELLAEEYDAAGFHGAAVDARSSEPSPNCAVTIRAIRRALGTARQSEGVVVVPREPTPEMIAAGTLGGILTPNQACASYQAQVIAAPGGEGEG